MENQNREEGEKSSSDSIHGNHQNREEGEKISSDFVDGNRTRFLGAMEGPKDFQVEHVESFSTPLKSIVNIELSVGKRFNSIDEAQDCYNNYAGMNGFSIRKRSGQSSIELQIRNGVLFVCHCEGNHQKKNPTAEEDGKIKRISSKIRVGCKARMRLKWFPGPDLWEVFVFNDEHNHQLVTPSKRIHLKSNRILPKEAKILAERFKEQNIPISKVVTVLGDRDKVSFDNRDLYNHLRNVRNVNYEEGDAEGVRRYFQKAAAESPHFYYAIQCDEWGRAANFFWIDARSRIAYGHFGDAVTFDTTYNTNKYKMPFAPFTGVNHHRQSLLFGCALLENETEETFIWLFETWLDAMGGKAPCSIITDQDPAMTKAIAKVFPNTRHRFCLWHIKKKFAEKISHIFFKTSKFKKDDKKCTRLCHSIEEFEERWAALLVEYDLQDNNWMTHIYVLRKQWIPVHCRNTFFAGMNTTQRSESINSFFDKFVTATTDLREFVRKYDEAMVQNYVSERKEDYESIYKKRCFLWKDFLFDHAANIYTKNLFLKFMEEVDDYHQLRIVEREMDGDVRTYMVQCRTGDTYEWEVKFNLVSKEGSCGCQLFEFVGFPCKHLVKAFDRLCLDEIPTYFILKRWLKDANRVRVTSPDGNVMQNKYVGSEAAKICDFMRRASQLAYIMCKSDEGYEKGCEMLDKGFEEAREIDERLLQKENEMANEDDGTTYSLNEAASIGASHFGGLLLDPHISQAKGRKKATQNNEIISSQRSTLLETSNKRFLSGLEMSTSKKPRICKICKGEFEVKHDSRNCPLNPKKGDGRRQGFGRGIGGSIIDAGSPPV